MLAAFYVTVVSAASPPHWLQSFGHNISVSQSAQHYHIHTDYLLRVEVDAGTFSFRGWLDLPNNTTQPMPWRSFYSAVTYDTTYCAHRQPWRDCKVTFNKLIPGVYDTLWLGPPQGPRIDVSDHINSFPAHRRENVLLLSFPTRPADTTGPPKHRYAGDNVSFPIVAHQLASLLRRDAMFFFNDPVLSTVASRGWEAQLICWHFNNRNEFDTVYTKINNLPSAPFMVIVLGHGSSDGKRVAVAGKNFSEPISWLNYHDFDHILSDISALSTGWNFRAALFLVCNAGLPFGLSHMLSKVNPITTVSFAVEISASKIHWQNVINSFAVTFFCLAYHWHHWDLKSEVVRLSNELLYLRHGSECNSWNWIEYVFHATKYWTSELSTMDAGRNLDLCLRKDPNVAEVDMRGSSWSELDPSFRRLYESFACQREALRQLIAEGQIESFDVDHTLQPVLRNPYSYQSRDLYAINREYRTFRTPIYNMFQYGTGVDREQYHNQTQAMLLYFEELLRNHSMMLREMKVVDYYKQRLFEDRAITQLTSAEMASRL